MTFQQVLEKELSKHITVKESINNNILIQDYFDYQLHNKRIQFIKKVKSL